MERFRARLQARIPWLVGLYIAAILFTAVSYFYKVGGPSAPFIRGAQIGLSIVLQAFALSTLIRYSEALKDAAKLKTLAIAVNDERNKYIRDRIGGGYTVSITAVAIAAGIAGSFDAKVFFTLLAVVGFQVLVKLALKIYFNHRY